MIRLAMLSWNLVQSVGEFLSLHHDQKQDPPGPFFPDLNPQILST